MIDTRRDSQLKAEIWNPRKTPTRKLEFWAAVFAEFWSVFWREKGAFVVFK